MSKMYHVALYMRLSREDENKNGESESIKNQRDFLLDYITKENLIVTDEYIDDGISGTTFDRKEFNRMISDIEKGKINMVITKDFSRLGRDYIEAGHYTEKYFPEKRVRYISVNDGIDTYLDTLGNEMLPFKAVINDLYCKDISKKIKSTLLTKKKQGLYLGASAPYGYKKSKKNKYQLVVDRKVSFIVQKMYSLYLGGYSLQKIRQYLSENKICKPSVYKNMKYKKSCTDIYDWDIRTIADILKNPNYTGNLTQGRRKKINYKSKKVIETNPSEWIVKENTHEPIIDIKTFTLVNNMLLKNRNKKGIERELLFHGLLYCKECGHRLGINTSQDKKRHYTICNHYRKYSKKKVCTPHSMRYEEIESRVLEEIRYICKTFLSIESIAEYVEKNNTETKKEKKYQSIREIENHIQRLQYQLRDMYSDKLNHIITVDIYKEYSRQIHNEIESETQLLHILQAKNKVSFLQVNDREAIQKYLQFTKPNRRLLQTLIDKIVLDQNKNIEIYYTFQKEN